MARLTGPTSEGVAKLLPYFNSLMGAVEQGGTTSQLWTAYRQAMETAGGEPGGVSIYDMNLVAGYARNILTAEGNLGGMAGPDALSSGTWAWAPWAAGSTDAWIQDRYQIRYQATLTGPNGEQQPIWGVTDWESSLEGITKDQIWARATQSAQEALDSGSPGVQAQLGMAEGFNLSEVARVQIMRI